MKKKSLPLTPVLIIFSLAFCNKKDANTNPQTYVLVHGAWRAPYLWDAVRADLLKTGNNVIVIELPGHGADTIPAYKLSLDVYSNKFIEFIFNVNGKVIRFGP